MSGVRALVTGAASGIGEATARRLAHDGAAALVLVDRDAAALAGVTEALARPGLRVLPRVADVADPSGWDATEAAVREQLGGLDRVVVNAGVSDASPIAETSFEAWRRVLAVNLDGAFLTLRAGLRLIRAGGRGGAIVVVGSAAAVKAEPGVGAYGASKAGAVHLTKVAAREGAPDGIRVNALLPGGVQTPIWRTMPFFRDLIAAEGSEEAAFAKLAGHATPLGRYATADETAAQIAFLLSDAASTITGAALVADGGYAA